ncbi:hypothetical protein BUE80_DR011616, partial [Diplocarpon rosae]
MHFGNTRQYNSSTNCLRSSQKKVHGPMSFPSWRAFREKRHHHIGWAFEELAKSNPNVTFIHKHPGFVTTGVIDHFLLIASRLDAFPPAL